METKKPLVQSRLDFWLIPNKLQDVIKDTGIKPAISTDHSLIYLNMQTNCIDNSLGPSYWKFNSSLCEDVNYSSSLRNIAPTWFLEYESISDDRIRWELIKFEIRKFAQNYCKQKAKDNRARLKNIENTVNELEIKLGEDPSVENKDAWINAKNNLEAEYDHITQGIMIRTRADWVEQGEKSNKYFLGLEKTNKNKSTIRTILTNDNKNTHDQKRILCEIKDYYKLLYDNKDENLNSEESKLFLNENMIPKLSSEDQQTCEGLLTMDECFKTLNTFKNNKSPGNDGLTAEFYKAWWHLFGIYLVNSLNSSYQKGELSNSQNQGIITLILKKIKIKGLLRATALLLY